MNQARTLYSPVPLPEEVAVSGGISAVMGWGVAAMIILLSVAAGVATQFARYAAGNQIRH